MQVTMMQIAQGFKDMPWISSMDDRFPAGTPVWYVEVPRVRSPNNPDRVFLAVSEFPDEPSVDALHAHGWFAPKGAVTPLSTDRNAHR